VGLIYNLVIFFYVTGLRLAAALGHKKARLWVSGRKNWAHSLKEKLPGAGIKRIWIHCASLGEFEQGRPLIEKIHQSDPEVFIVLSFFSPSGYEIRKNYEAAGLVCYLPSDTRKHAERFIDLVNPEYVLFIKYEFWYHYLKTLHDKGVPVYLVSALFRPTQLFFRWYGGFYREILRRVRHFFVQDEQSLGLLRRIGVEQAEVSGDTRFDRVARVVSEEKKLEILDRFCAGHQVLIAGSTWPEDERTFLPALSGGTFDNLKIVIAPHEINEHRIRALIDYCSGYFTIEELVRYSVPEDPAPKRILILDNIGILSSAYRYGTVAWIGGGFGKGIHNILEAAAYGLPVIFGPNYQKFNEAKDLLEAGGAFTVEDAKEAEYVLQKLLARQEENKNFMINFEYVRSKTGATERIYSRLPKLQGRK
jgi:3-deoxy-D-manno-octulosonic-acid transferase